LRDLLVLELLPLLLEVSEAKAFRSRKPPRATDKGPKWDSGPTLLSQSNA
jgi:hypothetical protein